MDNNIKVDKKIWAAIITGAVAIIVALIQFHPWDSNKQKEINTIVENKEKKEKFLSGTVVEQVSNGSISGAIITIVGRNEQVTTNGFGNFKIDISDNDLSSVRIRVTKPGFNIYEGDFDLPYENIIIQLIKKL